jgi:hypothetical protein
VRSVSLPNWVEQQISSGANASANDNNLWVEYGNETADGLTEPSTQLAQNAQCARVALEDCLVNL